MAWQHISMETKRPQLSPDEMQQLRWLLGGALTLLSVVTVFYLDVEAWTLMALTMLATIAVLVRPTWPARVPKLAHTLAFPLIAAFFLGDLWIKGEMLPAMVRLDILLLLYRSISYRQRRDDMQIIVLGLFLIVVAGVLTVSLAFAVQVMVFAGCALAFLLAITIAEAESNRRVRPNAPNLGEPPRWAVQLDWGRLGTRLQAVSDWRVLVLGGVLFAGVVAVAALLFLAIPRFQLENSLFLERFISKKSRTGFSDSIKFGDVTEIQQDFGVALSVDVPDAALAPASPYWRMLVMDEYRDGGFKLSAALIHAAVAGERTAAALLGTERAGAGAPAYWTFYLESGVSRYLPLPGRFGELRFREAQHFRPSTELAVVALVAEPATMTAYRVEGMTLADALPDPAFAARWRKRDPSTGADPLLQRRINLGPEDREILGRLAAELGDGGAAEFGRMASAWLMKQHGYSLSPQIPRGAGDPLVRWLASREAGHCELFAGSFVLLARTAGYAARVVVGFRGGTWNGYSNNFTVRNSDAHAWAEIWDEKRGAWLRVDPLAADAGATAKEIGADGAALARRTDRSWTARFDSLRVFWYRRIVNFDARSQEETLAAVKTATQNTGRRAREMLEHAASALRAWLAGPWDARRWAGVLAVIAGGTGVIWLWRNFRYVIFDFRLGRRGRREDPVRREAGRLLAQLREGREGDGRGAAGPEETETRAELQRLRFGARETWREPVAVLRRARGVARTLRRRGR